MTASDPSSPPRRSIMAQLFWVEAVQSVWRWSTIVYTGRWSSMKSSKPFLLRGGRHKCRGGEHTCASYCKANRPQQQSPGLAEAIFSRSEGRNRTSSAGLRLTPRSHRRVSVAFASSHSTGISAERGVNEGRAFKVNGHSSQTERL